MTTREGLARVGATARWTAAAGAPRLGAMDGPVAELAELGWRAEVSEPGADGAGKERWALPVPPADAGELPHSWHVAAVREPTGRGSGSALPGPSGCRALGARADSSGPPARTPRPSRGVPS